MRYFIPKFQLATLAPPQSRLQSKIGGIPWGLPPHLWPRCCNHPQKLLAQLLHHPPMLNLGQPNTVLFLFQCHECLGIANPKGRAAFILPKRHLHKAPTRIPGYDYQPELGSPLIGEAFITGWTEHDDGIPPSRLPEFFNERKFWALQDQHPEINWYAGREKTRFGGSPRWTGNGPHGFPRRPYEFLFQLDDYLFIDGPPPSPDDAGCVVTLCAPDDRSDDVDRAPSPGSPQKPNAPYFIMHEKGANEYYFEYTNLGSDGTAYAFINRTRSPPAVKWFWNR